MDFEYCLATIAATSIGRAPNGGFAPATIRMLEENKPNLNIDGSISNKMYLYLLFLINRRQTKIRTAIREGKDISTFSDEDFIEGFNTIIENVSEYRRDDLKPYFLEFKAEIDKRPMVSANLILAGFDFIAKSTSTINNDLMFARLVDNKSSYATKTYVKYLTEDNLEYFMMTDLFSQYERAGISLSKIRDNNLIKNNYHLYLMYCMGVSDLMDDDGLNILDRSSSDLYDHILKSKIRTILEKDKARKKLTLKNAKKFIDFFKDRALDSEHDIIDKSLSGKCLRISKEYTRGSWFSDRKPTGQYSVSPTGWCYYSHYMMLRYAIITSVLLDLFKDKLLEDAKVALNVLNSSIFVCSNLNDWINKNSSFYRDICSRGLAISSELSQEDWPYGGSFQEYRFKYEFNEPFPDAKYILEREESMRSYHSSSMLRGDRRVDTMTSIVNGLESTIKSLENN